MAFYRCKMCGGDLEIIGNETVCECAYCGTKQTVPTANDDKITNLFNRANQLRMVNRFDEAKKIYEDVLLEDNTSAEAHWGIILCKYGIEYVDDVKSGKKTPTCHRTIASPIFNDVDYLATLSNADDLNKPVYEAEANEIARIQKGILEQSANAENYDIFICYKETDDTTGARTEDSVIAQDLYFQLEKKGYKTFFARKTLENKLGTEYEPIIFSALNSAKVMVVLGTKPEHFESVWLKNEWSRFLDFTKNDSSRLLIPAYKDFSPYSLPGEFSSLQALDMGKIGFMQDLLDAIDKIANKKDIKDEKQVSFAGATASSFIERAYIFLEEYDFEKATEYAEKCLDIEPKNAQAYLCKYLASLNITSFDELRAKTRDGCYIAKIDNDFLNALKFSKDQLKNDIECFLEERNEAQYTTALSLMDNHDFEKALKILKNIADYKDSKFKINECEENINTVVLKKEEIAKAKSKIANLNNQLFELDNLKNEGNKRISDMQDSLVSFSKLTKITKRALIVSLAVWIVGCILTICCSAMNDVGDAIGIIVMLPYFIGIVLFVICWAKYLKTVENYSSKKTGILIWMGVVLPVVAHLIAMFTTSKKLNIFKSECNKSVELVNDVEINMPQIDRKKQELNEQIAANNEVIAQAKEIIKSIQGGQFNELEYNDELNGENLDPLFEDAVKLVLQNKIASISFLQRKLGIGYARASKIIDQLHYAGIIGPANGAKPREILINNSK